MQSTEHAREAGVPARTEGSWARFAERLVRIFDAIDRWVLVPLAVVALLVMTVAVFSDAVVRYTMDSSIPHLSDLTGKLFMPMVVFLGASFVAAVRGNVSVDLVTQYFSERLHRWALVLFDLIGAAILALVAYQFTLRCLESIGSRGATFEVPPALTYGIVGAGAIFAALRFLVCAVAGSASVEITSLRSARAQDQALGE